MQRIFKLRKHDAPYTAVSNSVIKDKRISLKARGLMVFLLSHPEDFSMNVKYIQTQTTDGRDAILSAVKELEICGYLHIAKTRTPDGRIYRTEWNVYEVPKMSIKEDTFLPRTDFPYPGNP